MAATGGFLAKKLASSQASPYLRKVDLLIPPQEAMAVSARFALLCSYFQLVTSLL
jgi:hypothetical protein